MAVTSSRLAWSPQVMTGFERFCNMEGYAFNLR